MATTTGEHKCENCGRTYEWEMQVRELASNRTYEVYCPRDDVAHPYPSTTHKGRLECKCLYCMALNIF